MAVLYVVSTPIGNLGDVTYRAVEVLRAVPHIMAEDTRRTTILLRKYDIAGHMVSAHTHNEQARVGQLLEWLAGGDDVALVSDAGTPLLSDPGSRLVRAVVDAGHDVVPVPGASALLAALVASGLDPEPFTFYGFIPRSSGQRTRRLEEAVSSPHVVIFYEAPTRLVRLLSDLERLCGPERRVVVAREMTKVHEDYFRGTLAEASAYYEDTSVRGEVVVLLDAAPVDNTPDPDEAEHLMRSLLESGEKASSAAREVARRTGIPRREAYRMALRQSEEAG